MRTVHLYGALADKYGAKLRLRGNTIGAIVKLMEANFPGFMQVAMRGEYRVVAGKHLDDEKGIQFDNALVRTELNLGSKDLHIMPVPMGASGGLRIVIGIALIAAAFYFAPLAAAGGMGATLGGIGGTLGLTYSSVAMFGVSMVLGGLAAVLTPTPKAGDYGAREAAEQRPSFIFNGAVNTTEQGGCVPVIYGRMRVGSVVISGGVVAEQI